MRGWNPEEVGCWPWTFGGHSIGGGRSEGRGGEYIIVGDQGGVGRINRGG